TSCPYCFCLVNKGRRVIELARRSPLQANGDIDGGCQVVGIRSKRTYFTCSPGHIADLIVLLYVQVTSVSVSLGQRQRDVTRGGVTVVRHLGDERFGLGLGVLDEAKV